MTAISAYPTCDAPCFGELTGTSHFSSQIELAGGPQALDAAKSHQLRLEMALGSRNSTTVQHRLAKDPCVTVRLRLANNRTAAESVLAQLAADRQLAVRIAVAGNPRAPLNALLKLGHDAEVHPTHILGTRRHPETITAVYRECWAERRRPSADYVVGLLRQRTHLTQAELYCFVEMHGPWVPKLIIDEGYQVTSPLLRMAILSALSRCT